MKKIKTLFPALLSLILSGVHIALRLPEDPEPRLLLRVLCDAFTLPGLLFLLLGLLVWLVGKGSLDGVGYLLKYTFRALIPGVAAKEPPSYHDYTSRDRKKISSVKWLPVGLADLLLAFLLLAIYGAV